MKISRTEFSGVLIIEPSVFGDDRGYFLESWNERAYQEAGLGVRFVQDNLSLSQKNVLRGLHFQNPKPQGKLVTVLRGEVFDVMVDLRIESKTFKTWSGLVLSESNHKQVYIPPGFAHGFLVKSETALFYYKCTEFYDPACESTIRWNDPDLGIEWGIDSPTVSKKDSAAKLLKEIPEEKLFRM